MYNVPKSPERTNKLLSFTRWGGLNVNKLCISLQNPGSF